MPIIGISITKETAFRESVQPFSNVYYYNNGFAGSPTGTEALALIDEVTAFEKTWHSNVVTFTYGRCWHQTLTEAGTVMLEQKPLTGAGAASADSNQDRERAVLIRWRAGNDSRGNPVYLRKWYHTCGAFGTWALNGTGVLANLTAISTTNRDGIKAMANDAKTLSAGGGGWELCSKGGRAITGGSTAECHRFLEHHQLGDQWRGD